MEGMGFLVSARLNAGRRRPCRRARREIGVVRASVEQWVESKANTSLGFKGNVVEKGVISGREFASLPEVVVLGTKAAVAEMPSLDGLVGKVSDDAVLAVFLVMSKFGGMATDFSEYVTSLPEELSLPMFWSKDELELLAGSPVKEKVENLKGNIEFEYNEVSSLVDGTVKEVLTLDRYMWAQGILFSRSFAFPPTFSTVFAPALDSLPVSPEGNCTAQESRSGLFGREKKIALVAERDLNGGEELTLKRTAETNAQYLLDFGVAFEDRPELNRTEIFFEVSSMDPFFDDKENILEEAGLSTKATFSVTEDSKEVFGDIGRFMRLVCISALDAFLLEPVFRGDVWEFMEYPVSKENEQQMAETIISACDAQIEEYAATEDAAAQSERAKLANIVVSGEKAALQAVKKFFERELKTLDGKEYYQERRLREMDLLRPIDPSEIVDSESASRSAQAFDDYY